MAEEDKASLTPVDIRGVEENIGAVPTDITPRDKLRRELAYTLLGGVAAMFLISFGAMLCASTPAAAEAAKSIFEFSKSFGPPIVTLVIGYYFRGESNDD